MGKKVTGLKIDKQNGTDSTYFASWSFTSPTVTTYNKTKLLNSVVTIKSGATYYNGAHIPDWVMSDQWHVIQVDGNRAVLGKNVKKTHDIQGAINTKYLTVKNSSSSTSSSTCTLDHYAVHWYYATGEGVWFDGGSSDVKVKNAIFSVQSNYTKIKVTVKPVAKKHKVNKKDVAYWTGTSVSKEYKIAAPFPEKPSAPTVKIEKFNLTASLENISDPRTDRVQFEVYKGNKKFKTGTVTVKTARASYTCKIEVGDDYRVRCRGVNYLGKKTTAIAWSAMTDETGHPIMSTAHIAGRTQTDILEYGPWSEYSSSVGTVPSAPSGFVSYKALSETSVYLDWNNVKNAKNYEVQYTKQKRYFDSSTSEVKSMTVEAVVGHAEITGLDSGTEWFFRVRATNTVGNSGWTKIVSIILGKKPSPPTTWSSTTTAISGEPVTLYWIHNSEDGSSQTYAQLQLIVNGTAKDPITIKNSTKEDEKDLTSSYSLDTTSYNEGAKIEWRVRTKGVAKNYSDWSVVRSIDIYAPPTLEISLTKSDGNTVSTVTEFPFYLNGLAGPKTQSPIGYSVTIAPNQTYKTVDSIGNETVITAGETIYSRYFDITDPLLVEFLPSNLDLENDIEYTLTCIVSMNSGLTAEASETFDVSWVDEVYEPDAGITIDEDTLVAYIKPQCVDADDTPVENILLSVYRREYDGSFVEIATDLANETDNTVTDPHPALDYARYRVVATSKTTGAVSFYDVPAYPVNGSSIVLQWDEAWSVFDTYGEDEVEEPPWTGSMLKLPYNVDVSNSNKPDVSLIEYIGREHPVSYYGTQVGETATWNVEIIKEDTETLYGLRRLSKWMGDVYVREPSGSGYWANITVSFSQTHTKLTIPVTINVTRVEGGA